MHVYTWLAHLDIRIDQNTPFFNKRLKTFSLPHPIGASILAPAALDLGASCPQTKCLDQPLPADFNTFTQRCCMFVYCLLLAFRISVLQKNVFASLVCRDNIRTFFHVYLSFPIAVIYTGNIEILHTCTVYIFVCCLIWVQRVPVRWTARTSSFYATALR